MSATAPAVSKISERAFDGAVWSMFSAAILAAAIRTVIKIRRFHRVSVDDCLLFLGIATLSVGTAFLYIAVHNSYQSQKTPPSPTTNPLELLQAAADGTRVVLIADVMLWTTVFAIKFSFLFFFRSLVDRLPRLTILWWITLCLLVPFWGLNTFLNFVSCPKIDVAHIQYCFSPKVSRIATILTIYSTCSDVVTDVLLISIPLCVLYKSKLRPRQKLGLGILFSLGIFMIIMSIVRSTDQNTVDGNEDLVWLLFWIEMEACVAVLMVSMTAFRTLFVSDQRSKAPGHSPNQHSPRYLEAHPGDTPRKSKFRTNKSSEPGIDTMIGMEERKNYHGKGSNQGLSSFDSDEVTRYSEGQDRRRIDHDHGSFAKKPSQESFV